MLKVIRWICNGKLPSASFVISCERLIAQAVVCRRLSALDRSSGHVGFALDKDAMGQILSEFRFPLPVVIPPIPSLLISVSYYLRYILSMPEELSQYSDWIRDVRRRGRSSSPGMGTSFLLSTSFGSGTHSSSCPMDTDVSFSVGKPAGDWSWPLISN
jgi:hypothetical protein